MRVEVRNLSKKIGQVTLLRNVSFEAGPGSVTAIYGGRKTGKTTLLKCIAGLQVFEEGQVLFDDRPLHRGDYELRKKIFYLPANPVLLPDKSVLRNIGLALKVYDADGTGAERKMFTLLNEFGLINLADVPAGKLAPEQMYAVGLAMTVAINPAVWLLDDFLKFPLPDNVLESLRTYIRYAILENKTVIFATDNIEVAAEYAECVFDLARQQGQQHEGDKSAAQPRIPTIIQSNVTQRPADSNRYWLSMDASGQAPANPTPRPRHPTSRIHDEWIG